MRNYSRSQVCNGNKFFKKKLFILLLFLIPLYSFAFGIEVLNTDILHNIEVNPGLLRFIQKPELYINIPLGLFSLLLPERNPVLYFTDSDTFQDNFDVLSFYEQMTYLDSFLFNPAASPDEIIFTLNNEGLDITFPDNETYTFSELYWKPKSAPFIPGSILQYVLPVKPFYICMDLYAGTSGLSLEPDSNLSGLLEDEELSPGTPYSLEALLSLRAGAAVHTTYIASIYPSLPWLEIYYFTRVGMFIDLAFAYTSLSLYFETNQENQPEHYSYTAAILSGYPFKGTGLGFRNDIGLNFIFYKKLMISLICLNLFKGTRYWGDQGLYTSAEEENQELWDDINSFDIKPSFYMQAMYDFFPFLFEFGLLVPSDPVALYYEGSISLICSPFTAGFSFTWRDFLSAKTFVSYTVSHMHIESGISIHQSPFLKKMVYGIFLSLGYVW